MVEGKQKGKARKIKMLKKVRFLLLICSKRAKLNLPGKDARGTMRMRATKDRALEFCCKSIATISCART